MEPDCLQRQVASCCSVFYFDLPQDSVHPVESSILEILLLTNPRQLGSATTQGIDGYHRYVTDCAWTSAIVVVINLFVTVWSSSLLQQNAVLEPSQLWTAAKSFISNWINTTLVRTRSWVLCISCGMPFAASCSAAVNSTCHLPGGDIDALAKPLPCNIVDEGFKDHNGVMVRYYSHQLQSFSACRGLIVHVIEGCRSRC